MEPPAIDRTIGEYLANESVAQFAISETQKYGHVTYFFNGNRTEKFSDELEDYVEITSDLVPFEERPWMKGAEICDEIIKALRAGKHKFYRINFPHGDMVGHTGNFLATMMSVETVDLCLARILPEVRKAGGVMVITADHGNADEMYEYDKKTLEIKYENGKPKAKTNHTLNPVPAIIYDPGYQGEYQLTDRRDLGISSLTATCLNLLGYNAPDDYDPSLMEFK